MKRTTIFLTDELVKMLAKLSRERGVAQSALIREALEQYGRSPLRRFSSIGAGASGRSDISSRFDELLFASEDGGRPRGKRGPRR